MLGMSCVHSLGYCLACVFGGISLSREAPTLLSTSYFRQLLQGDFKGFPSQLCSNQLLALSQGLLPDQHARNASTWRQPEGILTSSGPPMLSPQRTCGPMLSSSCLSPHPVSWSWRIRTLLQCWDVGRKQKQHIHVPLGLCEALVRSVSLRWCVLMCFYGRGWLCFGMTINHSLRSTAKCHLPLSVPLMVGRDFSQNKVRIGWLIEGSAKMSAAVYFYTQWSLNHFARMDLTWQSRHSMDKHMALQTWTQSCDVCFNVKATGQPWKTPQRFSFQLILHHKWCSYWTKGTCAALTHWHWFLLYWASLPACMPSGCSILLRSLPEKDKTYPGEGLHMSRSRNRSWCQLMELRDLGLLVSAGDPLLSGRPETELEMREDSERKNPKPARLEP